MSDHNYSKKDLAVSMVGEEGEVGGRRGGRWERGREGGREGSRIRVWNGGGNASQGSSR